MGDVFEGFGEVPLPPYLHRAAEARDREGRAPAGIPTDPDHRSCSSIYPSIHPSIHPSIPWSPGDQMEPAGPARGGGDALYPGPLGPPGPGGEYQTVYAKESGSVAAPAGGGLGLGLRRWCHLDAREGLPTQ